MRILLSAYSCGPGRGSEPGVGWNAALALSRLCEVHVLTTHEFKADIERLIAEGSLPPTLHFHFYDIALGKWVWRNPTGFRVRLHYLLWQRCATRYVKKLHEREKFDSAQHVTFVRYWSRSCLADAGIPYIFGPVGGAEYVPRSLLSGFSAKGRLFELLRNGIRTFFEQLPAVRRTIRSARFVLATTALSAQRIERIRGTPKGVLICGESALTEQERTALGCQHVKHAGVVFCGLGRLVPLKRYDLAVKAFARANVPKSRLRLIGGGEEESALRRLAESLGIDGKVEITGFVSRGEALKKLISCDVLLHPSTHDSGGWACIEGMAAGLPVICLDWGGPGTQVTAETGFRIPVGDEDTVVRGMADAMRQLSDPSIHARISDACKAMIQTRFSWSVKAERFADLHHSIWKAAKNG